MRLVMRHPARAVGLDALNKLANAVSLLLLCILSLCAARGVAAEDCSHAQPLAPKRSSWSETPGLCTLERIACFRRAKAAT
jgi:hypothetical protein